MSHNFNHVIHVGYYIRPLGRWVIVRRYEFRDSRGRIKRREAVSWRYSGGFGIELTLRHGLSPGVKVWVYDLDGVLGILLRRLSGSFFGLLSSFTIILFRYLLHWLRATLTYICTKVDHLQLENSLYHALKASPGSCYSTSRFPPSHYFITLSSYTFALVVDQTSKGTAIRPKLKSRRPKLHGSGKRGQPGQVVLVQT